VGRDRWVMAYECDSTGCRVTAVAHPEIGRCVDVGREGELALGVKIQNTQVSRRAVCVTPTGHGWQIEVTNRNGAVLHRWAQAPELGTRMSSIGWPLVGVRMLPDSGSSRHWVLLEADDVPVGDGPPPHGDAVTDLADRPGDLPRAEREALQTVFAAQLHWPPRQPAEPLLLKQAASRLGISISGVQERLRAARGRALRVGLDREVGLTDPSYLYVLVRAGYLPPPGDHPHRPR
jgi:hypothetical protein